MTVSLLLILCLGLGAGAVSTLLGIGGGIFIVPLLLWFTQMSVFEAIGTSLLTICLVTLVNTVEFSRKGLVRWRVGLMLGIPSGLVALISGYFALKAGEFAVQFSFLILLAVLAVATFLRRHSLVDLGSPPPLSPARKAAAISITTVGGFVSAFTGIGSGVILSPVMINFKMVRARELVPTTNLSTMLTTLAGCTGYLILQTVAAHYVDVWLGLQIFLVAAVTSHFLRPLQHKIPPAPKAIILSAILLFLCVRQAATLFF